MKRLAAKLVFVHRTLWHREQAYRWAFLFLLGPPPLLGCAVAALAWSFVPPFAAHAPSAAQGSDAPWAHWNRPAVEDGQPFTEPPTASLPRSDASGRYGGLQTGWTGEIRPMSVDATMEVNVMGSVLGSFTLDQSTIPLARILDAGPPGGLFAGTARTFFVVRTAGLYAFSARLTRSGTQSANCLVRLGSRHHKMLRAIVLNAAGDAVLKFPATEFRLEPGVFLVLVAVGCWRGDHMLGSGEMTLMVRHPGESVLKPVMADEVMRPVQH
jgi:hypothetical protein